MVRSDAHTGNNPEVDNQRLGHLELRCRNPIVALLLIGLVAVVGGCSEGKTHRTFDLNTRESMILSADLRGILVLERGGETIVCAEPQPDAVRAVAEQFATSLEVPIAAERTVGAELSRATQEAVASIGIRTPTIQLMRDLLYRACEAVMNGAIRNGDDGEDKLWEVARAVDNMTIALHAIDGLTGMGRAPAVTIGTVNAGNATAEENSATTEGVEFTMSIESGQTRTALTGEDLAAIAREVRIISVYAINDDDIGAGVREIINVE